MLEIFGMQQGGSQYRVDRSFSERIRGDYFRDRYATRKATVTHHATFNFMREARIWYSRDPNQTLLLGGFENQIVLSDEFFREVTTHSIPTDLEAVKALSSAPVAFDLACGCPIGALRQRAKNESQYSGRSGWRHSSGAPIMLDRAFRERLEPWVDLIRALWPGCPVRIDSGGDHMIIQPAEALARKGA
jgi:hypothetical protein